MLADFPPHEFPKPCPPRRLRVHRCTTCRGAAWHFCSTPAAGNSHPPEGRPTAGQAAKPFGSIIASCCARIEQSSAPILRNVKNCKCNAAAPPPPPLRPAALLACSFPLGQSFWHAKDRDVHSCKDLLAHCKWLCGQNSKSESSHCGGRQERFVRFMATGPELTRSLEKPQPGPGALGIQAQLLWVPILEWCVQGLSGPLSNGVNCQPGHARQLAAAAARSGCACSSLAAPVLV